MSSPVSSFRKALPGVEGVGGGMGGGMKDLGVSWALEASSSEGEQEGVRVAVPAEQGYQGYDCMSRCGCVSGRGKKYHASTSRF